MSISSLPLTQPDYAAIKGRQRQTWASGDYHVVASLIVPVSERLCEAVDLRAGQRVLDVATGSGNTAIAAARRLCDVTGVDYVPALLERGRARAAAEGLPVTFDEGDAEALPFADGAFDVVLSTFGAMFAPNQEQAARELLRVCRPGGRIGLANWTPRAGSARCSASTGATSRRQPGCGRRPAGAPKRACELFGDGVVDRCGRRGSTSSGASPRRSSTSTSSAPTTARCSRRSGAGRGRPGGARPRPHRGGAAFNRSDDGTLLVPSEYLEVVAIKR